MTGDAAVERRSLGRAGLDVTVVTVGGAPLGSMPKNFGYEVDRARGVAVARAALAGPFNALDTSSAYSGGESERRIGEAVRAAGGLPDGFVLSTKISRDLATGDFSGAEMRRSIAGSMERLGLDRFPLVYLHDPEHLGFEQAMAPGGPVEVLLDLKRTGVAQAVGVAGGPLAMLHRFVETDLFDVVLTHNRWTLVNRSAGALIEAARARGMGVVNAAPFGGGLLARGAGGGAARYAYRDAPPDLSEALAGIERACARHGVPLAAAALQFSTRNPHIATTVVGVSRPERIAETAALLTTDVPQDVWDEADAAAASLRGTDLPR